MCLTPCSVAIEFSILRATSVSSCAGDAPGSDAVDRDGRQVDVREVLDLHRPEGHQPDQRQQDEQQHRRNRVADRPGGNVHRVRSLSLTWCGGRRRVARDAHGVAVAEEAAAASRRRASSASRPPVISMRSPTRRPTSPWPARPCCRGRPQHVAEAVAQQHRALRQGERAAAAELELAAREHAGARRRRRAGRST